jgi:hypothetical protein
MPSCSQIAGSNTSSFFKYSDHARLFASLPTVRESYNFTQVVFICSDGPPALWSRLFGTVVLSPPPKPPATSHRASADKENNRTPCQPTKDYRVSADLLAILMTFQDLCIGQIGQIE